MTCNSLRIVVLLIAIPAGCSSSTQPAKQNTEQQQADAERDFREQLTAVAAGKSTAIQSIAFLATDATLAKLSGYKSLTDLNLGNTTVTDDGLKHLVELTNLEALRLGSSRVTSEGVASLSGLTNLKYLILQNAQLTDDGLIHLKGLKNLESLYIEGNQVTDAGIADLKKSLPELHVHW